jgi:hypothetical protein
MLIEAVLSALRVDSAADYGAWAARYADWDDRRLPEGVTAPYQQFLTRVVDERDDPVTDYFIEVCQMRGGVAVPIEEFEQDVHSWREDPSFRCFHVDLRALDATGDLTLRLAARSGTALIRYTGWSTERAAAGRRGDTAVEQDATDDLWNATIRIPATLKTSDGREVRVFYPFTTTLLEIRVNREPSFGKKGNVFWFEQLAFGGQPSAT